MITTAIGTSTLQVSDTISATNSSLDVVLAGGADLNSASTPSLDGITSLNALPGADNSIVNMSRLPNATMVTVDGDNLNAATNDEIAFNNVAADKVAWSFGGFNTNSGEVDINISSGDTGEDTSVNVTFTGSTGTGGNLVNFIGSTNSGSGGGVEALNIETKTAATRMDGIVSQDNGATDVLKTVTISGNQDLRLDNANGLDLVADASVDGSGLTDGAALNLGITAAGAVSVTGSDGDDRVIMDVINSNKTIDLGEGTNTLGLSGNTAVATGGAANASNYQVFELAGASTASQDADFLASGIDYLISSTGNGAGFTDLADGAKVTITSDTAGTTDVELKSDVLDDTLSMVWGSTDGTAQAINRLDADADGGTIGELDVELSGTGGVTITTNNILAQTITVTGGNDLTFTANTGDLDNSTNSFDARNATGDLIVRAAATKTAATSIRTGSGDDTVELDGGAGGDVSANLGSGDDTLTVTGAQEHSATLGDGRDTVEFDALAAVIPTGTDIAGATEFLTIADFVSGTDDFEMDAATFGLGAGALAAGNYVEGTLASTAASQTDVEAIASAAGIAGTTDYFAAIEIGDDVYVFYDDDHATANGVSLVAVLEDIDLGGIERGDFTIV